MEEGNEDLHIDADKTLHAEDDKKKSGRSAPILPWMRVPITIDPGDGTLLEDIGGLDPRLIAQLHAINVEVLFPVQTVVWEATAAGSSPLHDICLAAPTGSGKTLAYTLPIIQALASKHYTNVDIITSSPPSKSHMEALIVLPTRDLALQVFNVISPLCTAVNIPCFAACGRLSLADEAAALSFSTLSNTATTAPYMYSPRIVVATPGRLVAHLDGTPGFNTLCSLKYLVIDEADRLLRQSYQGWLEKILLAVPSTTKNNLLPPCVGLHHHTLVSMQQDQGKKKKRILKFIVSATLTRDPSKMERLQLDSPRYVAMKTHGNDDHRYKLPPGLIETKIIVPAEQKPLYLASLLSSLTSRRVVVFTSAIETTQRVALFLSSLENSNLKGRRIIEYSAAVPPELRRAALHAFKQNAEEEKKEENEEGEETILENASLSSSILVCSDAMTRGMDIESIDVVINYDAPVYAKTYVHRAGRTARAQRGGQVITLLRHEDVRHFKSMLRKADNSYVKDYRLDKNVVSEIKVDVEQALLVMRNTLESGQHSINNNNDGDDVLIHQESNSIEKKNKKKRKHIDLDAARSIKSSLKKIKKICNVPELKFSL